MEGECFMARKSHNRSAEQIERIKKRIECMHTVAEMLQYIVDHPDESERQIVSEFGIDYRQYRKYAYDENWMTNDPETAWNRSEDIMKQPTLTWQEQLWLDIHKLSVHDLDAIPVDVVDTIDEALNDMLHDESQYVINRARILILYYRDRLTYHEIGHLMGRSAETARTAIKTALRNMRITSPYINFGKRQKINEKLIAEQLHQKNLKLIELAILRIQDDMKPIEPSADESIVDESPNIEPIKPKISMDTDVMDLDLSVRTVNCISRAGINTVGDIFKRSKTDIASIRSLGRKSYDELMDRLEELGFKTYLDLMDD
jgi:hypothetical protein